VNIGLLFLNRKIRLSYLAQLTLHFCGHFYKYFRLFTVPHFGTMQDMQMHSSPSAT